MLTRQCSGTCFGPLMAHILNSIQTPGSIYCVSEKRDVSLRTANWIRKQDFSQMAIQSTIVSMTEVVRLSSAMSGNRENAVPELMGNKTWLSERL